MPYLAVETMANKRLSKSTIISFLIISVAVSTMGYSIYPSLPKSITEVDTLRFTSRIAYTSTLMQTSYSNLFSTQTKTMTYTQESCIVCEVECYRYPDYGCVVFYCTCYKKTLSGIFRSILILTTTSESTLGTLTTQSTLATTTHSTYCRTETHAPYQSLGTDFNTYVLVSLFLASLLSLSAWLLSRRTSKDS